MSPPLPAAPISHFNPSGNAANTQLADPYGTAGAPDPFPSQIPPPSDLNFNAEGLIPFGNGNNNLPPPNSTLKTPYIYQYNLDLQQQVSSGLMMEIGYVGSSSHKLLTWLDQNPFVLGTTTRILNQGLDSPNFGYLTTFAGLNDANYNGMIASLTQREMNVARLGKMFFTVGYTWSHNLDNGSGFNSRTTQIASYDHHALYGNSDFDIRQRLTISGGWDLPFDRAWANGPHRLTQGCSLYPIFLRSPVFHSTYWLPPSKSGCSGSLGRGRPRSRARHQATPSIQTFDPHKIQAFNGVTANTTSTPVILMFRPVSAARPFPAPAISAPVPQRPMVLYQDSFYGPRRLISTSRWRNQPILRRI